MITSLARLRLAFNQKLFLAPIRQSVSRYMQTRYDACKHLRPSSSVAPKVIDLPFTRRI